MGMFTLSNGKSKYYKFFFPCFSLEEISLNQVQALKIHFILVFFFNHYYLIIQHVFTDMAATPNFKRLYLMLNLQVLFFKFSNIKTLLVANCITIALQTVKWMWFYLFKQSA